MHFRKAHPAPGASPGSLVCALDSFPPRVQVIDFAPGQHDVLEVKDPAALAGYRTSPTTTWIDIQGLRDHDLLQRVAEVFDIHPLALEDAVNIPVRPKSEVYEHFHLLVLRMVRRLADGELERSQVTLFVGPHALVSMQERPGDVFDPVRKRTKQGNRMPTRGADYLAYALIDLVIDAYYPALEPYAERLEELEEEVTLNATREQVRRIIQERRELQELRRDIWPMREMVYELMREESPFISDETLTYLRDCYDHTVQLGEVIDGFLEDTNQLMSLHGAIMGNRMNEIMKFLTIMSTLFIPLGFLAGLYGMNFANMPELGWKWGYPALLGVMVIVVLVLLYVFRRRGWLGEE